MFSTLLLFLLFLQKSGDDVTAPYREASIKAYEKEIAKLEEKDRAEKDPENSILFVGSSSIRLWDTIHDDLKPWPVIQRGFGGSKYSDVAVFAPRLLRPHQYRALAIFVGNDITGSDSDKSPEEIVRLIDSIVQVSKAHRPEAKVFLIAITPTEKRWSVWPKIREANQAIAAYCQSQKEVHFIATEKDYLNDKSLPRPELFKDDKLHQNRDGYKIWSRIILTSFEKELGSPLGPSQGSKKP